MQCITDLREFLYFSIKAPLLQNKKSVCINCVQLIVKEMSRVVCTRLYEVLLSEEAFQPEFESDSTIFMPFVQRDLSNGE